MHIVLQSKIKTLTILMTSQTIDVPHVQMARQYLPFYFDLTMLPTLVRPRDHEIVMKK